MEQLSFLVLYALSFPLLLLYCSLRIFYSLWWKPKALEKQLRRQGISGNPYRLLYGDMKEEIETIKEASSKPINLTHQIVPRVEPFIYQTVQKYVGSCYLFQVGCFAYAGFSVWVADLLASPGRSFDAGA